MKFFAITGLFALCLLPASSAKAQNYPGDFGAAYGGYRAVSALGGGHILGLLGAVGAYKAADDYQNHMRHQRQDERRRQYGQQQYQNEQRCQQEYPYSSPSLERYSEPTSYLQPCLPVRQYREFQRTSTTMVRRRQYQDECGNEVVETTTETTVQE